MHGTPPRARTPVRLQELSALILSALILSALALTTTGCPHRTRETRPPITIPQRFSAHQKGTPPERWWRTFNDPHLNRLVTRALVGNLSLRAAWDRLDQARAAARKAGAARFPQLDATGSAGGTLSSAGHSLSGSLGLVASYEIDLWGRVRATRNAARLDALASQQTLRAAAISLSAEVVLTWFRLQEGLAQTALLDQQLALNQKVLKLVVFSFRKGQGQAADVLQQQQLVESAQGELAGLAAQTQIYKHQLAILLGHPPAQKLGLTRRPLPALPPHPPTGLPAELLRRRPDVRSAYFKVAAADRLVAAAIADRYPRLSIAASGSVTGGFNGQMFRSWLANLAANLLAPLFDGGARRAEVQRTRASWSEALNSYGQTVLVALREVEDALTRERHQGRSIASLDKQLLLSKSVVTQTRYNYLNGADTYLRVLYATIRHQALERSRIQAERVLLEYRVSLLRALAGGWKLRRSGTPARPQRDRRRGTGNKRHHGK